MKNTINMVRGARQDIFCEWKRLDEKHTDEEILAMFGNREMRKEPFFVAI